MRAAKLLAVLAIAALGIGSFSAVALAGKALKLRAKVDGVDFCDPAFSIPDDPKWVCHGPNPTVDKSGLVTAQVMLFQTNGLLDACWESRSLTLQVLNRNGKVLTTLDRTRTGKREKIRKLSGQLPTTLPSGKNYVRVKMKKRTVPGKVRVPGFVNPTDSGPAPVHTRRVVCQPGVSHTVDPSNGEIVAPANPK